VNDAGLVLVSPFLPHLFAKAGVLGERRIAEGKAGRAGALLHYAASGRATRGARLSPLVLVLCGLAPEADVTADPLTEEDVHVVDSMLEAMRQNWSVVQGSSIAGLRETFIQREGRLDLGREDRTELRVQRKPVDVLIDQIPWSFSMILHPWMTRPLHVSW
jgi:hypothetical protein